MVYQGISYEFSRLIGWGDAFTCPVTVWVDANGNEIETTVSWLPPRTREPAI
jgi:hypothetical protein